MGIVNGDSFDIIEIFFGHGGPSIFRNSNVGVKQISSCSLRRFRVRLTWRPRAACRWWHVLLSSRLALIRIGLLSGVRCCWSESMKVLSLGSIDKLE